MTMILDLGGAARQVATLLDGISDDQLSAPTPCEKYTVQDLLDHLLGLTFAFRVAAEKSDPAAAEPPARDWRTGLPPQLDALVAAWKEPAAWDGMTEAGGLTLPGEVAGQVALNELVVHGWDLAKATGQPYACDRATEEQTFAFLTVSAEPEHEAGRAGVFGPVVDVPAEKSLLERAIGLSGRDPEWTPPAATGERIVRANGVDLCVETFGDPGDPAILLIAGSTCSMTMWDAEFCGRLADGSRFVIRYDLRDTGRSVSYPPGTAPYTGHDLVADAVGLLDTHNLASAHVVGFSMGGGIAQQLISSYPDRVASLTLMSTSPNEPGARSELPGMADEDLAAFGAIPDPDWSDRASVAAYLAAQERVCAARSHPFDDDLARRIAGGIFDRADSIASITNHFSMPVGERGGTDQLAQIAAPTLVLHGTEDPVWPAAHGAALAEAIPGAQLIALDRTGHELPPRTWDVVVPAILRHTS